jgi:antitoxin Phd
MQTWQLQHAKARLSEVIQIAAKNGPQTITQRGVETAVVISMEEWKRLKPQRPHTKRTLLEVLQSGPHFEIPLPPRHRRMTRTPVTF